MNRLPIIVSLLFLGCSPGLIETSEADEDEGEEAGSPDGAPGSPAIDAAPASEDQPDAFAGGEPVEGEPANLQGILDAHNAARAAKGVVAMTWDNDLAAIATAWADGCVFEHNANRSDTYPSYVGENLYASSSAPSAAQVVTSWVSEEANYNYEANTCSGVCGHYTQVVWADSIKLGCALSNCPGAQWANIVVCDYGPGGNYSGQRPY